jgi:hypothetical protein
MESYFALPLDRANYKHWTKTENTQNSVALVPKRTIPTERPQLVGEVSANFSA